jgi:hypothetical protein
MSQLFGEAIIEGMTGPSLDLVTSVTPYQVSFLSVCSILGHI